jgi:hypothetical protein
VLELGFQLDSLLYNHIFDHTYTKLQLAQISTCSDSLITKNYVGLGVFALLNYLVPSTCSFSAESQKQTDRIWALSLHLSVHNNTPRSKVLFERVLDQVWVIMLMVGHFSLLYKLYLPHTCVDVK